MSRIGQRYLLIAFDLESATISVISATGRREGYGTGKFLRASSRVFTTGDRSGAGWDALQALYDSGLPVILMPFQSSDLYALDNIEADATSTPPLLEPESWMNDVNPFVSEDILAAKRVGRVTPNLGAAVDIPVAELGTITITHSMPGSGRSDNQDVYVQGTIPFRWAVFVGDTEVVIEKIRLHRVRAGLSVREIEVIEEGGTTQLSGRIIRVTQGDNQLYGILDDNNKVLLGASSQATINSFTHTTKIAVSITAPTTQSSGLVGTVGLVTHNATRPTVPTVSSSDVQWDADAHRLTNVPSGWYRLDDSSIPDVPANQHAWYAFAWVDASGNLSDFGEAVYGGSDAIQYTTSATPDVGGTTWTTDKANAKYMRVYGDNGYSNPIPISPRETLGWQNICTIEQPSNATGTTITRSSVEGGGNINLDELSEFKIRWRKLSSSGDINLVRVSKSIPIEELVRTLINWATIPNSQPATVGTVCFVMFGWTDGTFNDIIPFHPDPTIGAVNNADFDVAFMLNFLRPSGADGQNRLGIMQLQGMSTPIRRAYIDLLVR